MENDKETKKEVRCAIYTRKSTTEGLEQEFSSLDAQRESAENYIKSQHHQGWLPLKEMYDDGGFTGATTDRPALQKLLQDIKEKKIDCVVVYKVDRLSRSLNDFVRLLQFFEEHQITFVSVTQHFNTNTSMGRLTLNILLSFAQFEREMISERTRDKMGAARMKGKWVGGRPGIGYEVDKATNKLVINPEEAKLIREIFRLYLEKKSLLEVAQHLNEAGYRTKSYQTKNGIQGDVPFKNTNIQIILNNVSYIGKVSYGGKIYPGEHEPIVSNEIFEAAQALLKQNQRVRGVSKNRKFPGLFSGIFRCSNCGVSMCHGYATKNSYKYRYYTCLNAIKRKREDCPTKSIGAVQIEERCLSLIRKIRPDSLPDDAAWKANSLEEQIAAIQLLVSKIEYNGLTGKIKIVLADTSVHQFNVPLSEIKKKLAGNGSDFFSEPPIRRHLLLAHQIQQMLDEGRIKDFDQLADWLSLSKTRIDQITNLLFLCPKIQEEIIMGDSQRISEITEYAMRPISMETDWSLQLAAWKSLIPTPNN